MAKRKVLYVEEDDLNDGSDSDDSQEGYLPRTRGQRVHYIPAETITMGSHGVRSTMSSIPTPASPAKKSKVTLKPDVPAAPAFSFDDWEADYAEFDAEFGPGMQTTGPRKLRESVSLAWRFSSSSYILLIAASGRPSWAMGTIGSRGFPG
jgi:hypothetical protein